MFRQLRRQGISYYAFSELKEIPGLVHAFTSRRTDLNLPDAGKPAEVAHQKPGLLELLNVQPAELLTVRQIHSDRIVGPADCGPERPRADGILLAGPGRFGVIRTADCMPILAVAPRVRALCLVHAGWRGTRDHIARKGVEKLLQDCRTEAKDLIVAMGPAIRICCYEVGEEVLQGFRQQGHDLGRVSRGRHLDLAAANRADLEDLGVGCILDAQMCTACRADLFYSHRKLKDSGRMWALAGFRAGGST